MQNPLNDPLGAFYHHDTVLQLRCIALNGQWEDFMQYYIDQETARLYPERPTHRLDSVSLPMAA